MKKSVATSYQRPSPYESQMNNGLSKYASDNNYYSSKVPPSPWIEPIQSIRPTQLRITTNNDYMVSTIIIIILHCIYYKYTVLNF